MKPSQLKTMAIIILLLVNVFLLVQIIPRQVRASNEAGDVKRNLVSLLNGSGIEISAGVIPDDVTVSPLRSERSGAAEAEIAAAILGGVTFEEKGGGICQYVSDKGRALFRTNGDFSISLSSENSYTPASCGSLIANMGLSVWGEAEETSPQRGQSCFTYTLAIGSVPCFDDYVTFEFGGGGLQKIYGVIITSWKEAEGSPSLNPATALVRFLDKRAEYGIICRSVEAMTLGYKSAADVSGISLIPVWHIAADSGEYAVYSDGSIEKLNNPS